MDSIFLNPKNSDPSEKIALKRSDKYVALSKLTLYYIWKNI